MKIVRSYDAVVIGCSAGGLHALIELFEDLPADYRIPVMLVQHRLKDERELLEEVLQQRCNIKIRQANEKESIEKSTVFIAPPDYHLLVGEDRTFSLTTDEKVNYARPSIDVLFETAADVYSDRLAGIILTGSNSDGRNGIVAIRHRKGLTIAQDPREAEFAPMPKAAVDSGAVEQVLTLEQIKKFLLSQA